MNILYSDQLCPYSLGKTGTSSDILLNCPLDEDLTAPFITYFLAYNSDFSILAALNFLNLS